MLNTAFKKNENYSEPKNAKPKDKNTATHEISTTLCTECTCINK